MTQPKPKNPFADPQRTDKLFGSSSTPTSRPSPPASTPTTRPSTGMQGASSANAPRRLSYSSNSPAQNSAVPSPSTPPIRPSSGTKRTPTSTSRLLKGTAGTGGKVPLTHGLAGAAEGPMLWYENSQNSHPRGKFTLHTLHSVCLSQFESNPFPDLLNDAQGSSAQCTPL